MLKQSSSRPSRLRGTFALTLLAAAIGTATPALADPEVVRSVKVDERVYEIAFNPATQAVYAAVTGLGDDNKQQVTPGIVVLDASTLEQKNKIETGDVTPFGLGINTKTQKIYAVDTRKGVVGVYDLKSGKEVAVIENSGDESNHLRQAVVDEKANKIYISAFGGMVRDGKKGPDSAVWVIDGATDKLESVIVSPVQSAAGLALDADNKRLYVADLNSSTIAEIDLSTQKVLRTFDSVITEKDANPEPFDTINLEIDTKNGQLYAINQKSGGVSLIDLKSGKITRTVKTGDGALSARLHPQSGDLYVANRNDGTVSVVDADTHYVTAHLFTGVRPQTLAIDPKTGQVYVSNKSKGKGRQAPEDAPVPVEAAGNTITLITP
ncbi:YncE family protein [Oceanimonas baumannii]|nr:YncE family protein [Oceanimonas baumannii]TDW56350.1 YVTN family beta-propeller protein [Oceanimonas baumannii]